jgi:DNA-binding MarR family transcriptional regulator
MNPTSTLPDPAQAETSGDIDLTSRLPYLLNRVGVRIGAAFSEDIRRFGVSLHQWRILASLNHESPQNITELAGHTSIELSTLSRIVASMVRDGLLARIRSGEDARSVSLRLTDAGRETAERIIPLAALYERIALSGMSAEEVALLKKLLAKAYDNVVSLGPKPSTRRKGAGSRATVPAGVPAETNPAV